MDKEQRLQLLKLNCEAWHGVDVYPNRSNKLDSSIKRNTGFIKKLKLGITKDSKDLLLKDIGEVLLEKYLSEVIAGTNESLSKLSGKNEDLLAAVEVVSALHQRFGSSFTIKLMELFVCNFLHPVDDIEGEKEELNRVNHLKALLKLFTELYLLGLFNHMDEVPGERLPNFLTRNTALPLANILKYTIAYNHKNGIRLSLAITFIKRYPGLCIEDDTSLDEFIHHDSLKTSLKELFTALADNVLKRTAELSRKLNKLRKEHQKAQIRTGKLFDEYAVQYKDMRPVFERYKAAADVLAEYYNLQLPELADINYEIESEEVKTVITTPVKNNSANLWSSEEIRKFYEDLPSISKPGIELANSNSPTTKKLNKFFSDLEECETKEMIDKLSERYWSASLDNKATRKRLVKVFTEQEDMNKLRLYARFLATNVNLMPDVKDEIVEYLDSALKTQFHNHRINVKHINYFCEMVKFGLVPKFIILYKIRVLVMNLLLPYNIEILTVFFENLGRFLNNNPEYSAQMANMMELIREKKKDHRLPLTCKNALENLILLIYPPKLSSSSLQGKTLTVEQRFYRALIRKELHLVGFKKTTALLKRANWKDEDVYKTLLSLFTKPHKIGYQSISLMAECLASIYLYRREFVVRTVDAILENIERNLEINEDSYNMKQIAQVTYMSWIFNYGMVRSEVILETMYHILKYGYPNGRPTASYINPYDLPDDYFRIRLISTIISNMEKTTPNWEKKFPLFLRFFEYYILTKSNPLPKDIEACVSNIFDSYASTLNFERATDISDCVQRLEETLKQMGVKKATHEEQEEENDEPVTVDVSENDSSDDDSSDNQEVDAQNNSPNYNDNFNSDSQVEVESNENSDDSDDAFIVTRDLEKKRIEEEYGKETLSYDDLKAEEEMEKQYQLVMQQALESRKNEKVSMNSIPILASGINTYDRSGAGDRNSEDKPGKVAFTFLNKSGKKTQARSIALPDNVKFVSDALEGEQRLKSERERIKKIVLSRNFE
ncbi:HCL400Cp [Eremothecium sinecaudum]|uniref:HCL400Cp n=1 Tax=Eremothecium sinecaudum TaxID=45286 RepID=A0A109UY95_9SACH|nr:HCL400Cp [Eremothecium sinecaudum]AMD19751.1 HCL400Cp [Eremothecium sinecaudum]